MHPVTTKKRTTRDSIIILHRRTAGARKTLNQIRLFFSNLTLKILAGAKNGRKITNNYFEAILSTSPSL